MKMCDIFQNKDDRWVEAMMSDLVRIHSPSEIETSSIHQIADLSNRMQYVECAQLELAKSNGGFKVICDNSIPPQMRLSNRSPIPIDSESNHLK